MIWFRQREEIDQLRRQNEFLVSQLEREQQRTTGLDKKLDAERKAKDKILLRHADIMTQSAKLNPKFVLDAEPQKPPVPEPLTLIEEEGLRNLAQKMRDDDIDKGIEESTLDVYMTAILNNRDYYLAQLAN